MVPRKGKKVEVWVPPITRSHQTLRTPPAALGQSGERDEEGQERGVWVGPAEVTSGLPWTGEGTGSGDCGHRIWGDCNCLPWTQGFLSCVCVTLGNPLGLSRLPCDCSSVKWRNYFRGGYQGPASNKDSQNWSSHKHFLSSYYVRSLCWLSGAKGAVMGRELGAGVMPTLALP